MKNQRQKVDARFQGILMYLDGKDVWNMVQRLLPREVRHDFKIKDVNPKNFMDGYSTERTNWEVQLVRKEKIK